MEQKLYIKGNYRKSIYSNEKGYVIGLFKIRETNDNDMEDYINKTISFTGYFHDLNEDDTYLFYGEGLDHPKYGFQYQVNEYERVKVEGRDGVIEFLSSDLFPKVGKKLATSIADTLGEDAISIIINNPEQLLLVPKLTKKLADMIIDILNKYEESHKVIVYLSDLGFSTRDALNIYNLYRQETIRIVELNVYSLINNELEITFNKVDKLREKLNIDILNDNRVRALIIYLLQELCFKTGDTYIVLDKLYKELCTFLNTYIEEGTYASYLNDLVDEEKIFIDNNDIYLMNIYESEVIIANKIKKLASLKKNDYNKIDELITELEKTNNISYNSEQKLAIIESLNRNITVITGGPGTGKTTIIKAIVELYKRINKLDYDSLIEHISLLAPTGKAAKRMSESTLLPASTIHRFLKWNKETDEFRVNEFNQDKSKLIILDEASMVDTELLASLFKGILDDVKLIIVGDVNQLPSVRMGQILKDIIESNKVHTIKLEQLYRQDENSYINILAREIKTNQLTNFTETKSDFTFLQCESSLIKNNLIKIVNSVILKNYDIKKVQVLIPLYKGENGIDNINVILQDVFNPADSNKVEFKYGDVIYRENDKILQLINMPDDNVFNGDIGIITKIIPSHLSDVSKNEIYIDFDGNTVKYLPKDFNNIKHGYAISIHKSQGGEFDLVIIPICNSYSRMLYRKLVYTGVTRAKKKLIMLGNINAFINSVERNYDNHRNTGLLKKIIN